jgi:hypothetical protein
MLFETRGEGIDHRLLRHFQVSVVEVAWVDGKSATRRSTMMSFIGTESASR